MRSSKASRQSACGPTCPVFRAGDTVKVHVKVKEGDKERIQIFQGVCIARKHGGIRETVTVRKISNGIGVERIFPLHSPIVDKVELVQRGRIRRAKLYYLRAIKGKKARIEELRGRIAGAGPVPDLLLLERRLWAMGKGDVAGVDEAGRGALFGPVVAAAVILDRGPGPVALPRFQSPLRLPAREGFRAPGAGRPRLGRG